MLLLGKLQRPHCGHTGNVGNGEECDYPQLAELFRSVNYHNLPTLLGFNQIIGKLGHGKWIMMDMSLNQNGIGWQCQWKHKLLNWVYVYQLSHQD